MWEVEENDVSINLHYNGRVQTDLENLENSGISKCLREVRENLKNSGNFVWCNYFDFVQTLIGVSHVLTSFVDHFVIFVLILIVLYFHNAATILP